MPSISELERIAQEAAARGEPDFVPAQQDRPLLGLATTRELLEELMARAEVHGYADYRTVGRN